MFANKMVKLLSSCSKMSTKHFHASPIRLDDLKLEKSLNLVTLLGRVGNDPQKRGTEEHPVVTFSLATHYNYKYESGDMVQKTEWHRIVVFRPYLRDTIYNYLKKGQRVHVTGKLSYGEIKTEDGQVRSTCSIVAEDVIFFQSAPSSQ
ncbi:mitochondrial single stranded DNA-binding protein [Arctopsyche grandis]|uniref:mitochondrial single stranded DNA-binding protein n=1 Tax=Arctopsyche grandis TaxID=121162 RepID=UPI00406D98F3